MSSQYVFQMYRLSKVFPPDRTVLKDITLAFLPGAKIGVLGYNGAGKSTVLRIMAGVETDFRGDAALAPGATVGLLEQEPQLDPSKDVRGNVEEGLAEMRGLLDRFEELAANYSEDTADEFARLQAEIDAADAWSLDTQLEHAMDALRLPPPDAEVANLSGGERRRVALCRLLLSAPDLLLLDEPTNHLDAESVAWLERHLAEYDGAIVAVTHDRYFLDNIAGWILELDRGKGIPYEGNYSAWLDAKTTRLLQQERQDKARQRVLAAELEWVRTNPKGRRTKSKARLARYEEMVNAEQAQKLAGWGVIASVQPLFDAEWGGEDGMYVQRLGDERGVGLNPFSRLAAAGVVLAFGSDTPVTAIDPWATVKAAVHHKTEGFGISPRAAFVAHTRGGWRAVGRDDAGMLVPGAPADYAVWRTGELVVQAPDDRVARWSTDPRSGTPGLPDLTPGADLPVCLRTVVLGQTVYVRPNE